MKFIAIVTTIILTIILYVWLTKPTEKYDNNQSIIIIPKKSKYPVVHCSSPNIIYTSPWTDLKADCWEAKQMRALIDNSPTKQTICDIRPNCTEYVYSGDYPHY